MMTITGRRVPRSVVPRRKKEYRIIPDFICNVLVIEFIITFLIGWVGSYLL